MHNKNIIARVQQMEQYMDEVSDVLKNAPQALKTDAEILKKVEVLTAYMDSGQWLADYEADERGELPADLKRGVLSQDGLYNLISDVEAFCREPVRKQESNISLYEEIQNYQPVNEQEERDKKQMLDFIQKNPDYLLRDNLVAHFTASVWTVNKERTKTLMVYHNIYNSWSWIGGHADGEEDLCAVAMRELQEETGVTHARLVSEDIFSLETIIVDGHEKRGVYVPSHLHMNVTYLAEADEKETLRIKEDENQAVKWWTLEEALQVSTEPWMVERIYKKLIGKCKEMGAD